MTLSMQQVENALLVLAKCPQLPAETQEALHVELGVVPPEAEVVGHSPAQPL